VHAHIPRRRFGRIAIPRLYCGIAILPLLLLLLTTLRSERLDNYRVLVQIKGADGQHPLTVECSDAVDVRPIAASSLWEVTITNRELPHDKVVLVSAKQLGTPLRGGVLVALNGHRTRAELLLDAPPLEGSVSCP